MKKESQENLSNNCIIKKEVIQKVATDVLLDDQKSIIRRLKHGEITKEEADKLLNEEKYVIREYAVYYATKEKVLEVAVSEEEQDVVVSIIVRLQEEEMTKEEANKLLNAKNWKMREYAVKYATKEKVLEMAMLELSYSVAVSIIVRLEKEGITREEADKLLNAKKCEIRKYAVENATKEKVLETAMLEPNCNLVVSIIGRLEKEEITKEEADKLLNANNWGIREYAVENATKEKVLEAAVSEKDNDVVVKIIQKLEKEGITKEEVKKLVTAKSYFIRTIAKTILKEIGE